MQFLTLGDILGGTMQLHCKCIVYCDKTTKAMIMQFSLKMYPNALSLCLQV